MKTEYLSPFELNRPVGFSHVTIVGAGRLVFVAGQVARDAAGRIVGSNDLAVQTEQVYENLKTALAAAGATMKDVVKVVTYVVGLTAEK
ncbi:RidA family protein, partial [Escherichia coli]|nr:RidA family protein [Escherichia coli]